MARCSQEGCEAEATHRMFWPGATPRLICQPHEAKARSVAGALEMYLHTEPVPAAPPTSEEGR